MLTKNLVILLMALFLTVMFSGAVNAYNTTPRNFYDVKAYFSAKGNGSTDDKTAIQNAINAAVSDGGGTIYFGVGTFKISSNITFPANVDLGFSNSAVLAPDSGVVVTINGGLTNENILTQIFAGAGSYVGNIHASLIRPEWFGAVRDNSTDNNSSFTRMCSFVNQLGFIPKVEFSPGTYKYSAGLSFTREVILNGARGVTLNYSGTGKAVTLGPSNLNSSTTFTNKVYEVRGLGFAGGGSMTHGLYFSQWVQAPVVADCYFQDYGNSSSYGVYFQAANWHITIKSCCWFSTPASASPGNWIWVNGNYTDGSRDYGQSQLRMMDCIASNQSNASGVGIYVNGQSSVFTNNKIEGFSPNIQLGAWSGGSVVANNYFEVTRGSGCIAYGDNAGRLDAGNWSQGLTIQNNYCNLHNVDLNTDAYFVYPATTTVGIQYMQLLNNSVNSVSSGRELVEMNNFYSQIYNTAMDNSTNGALDSTIVHTSSSNIGEWLGNQGLIKLYKQIPASQAQNGTIFEDMDGNLKYKNLGGTVTQLSN